MQEGAVLHAKGGSMGERGLRQRSEWAQWLGAVELGVQLFRI